MGSSPRNGGPASAALILARLSAIVFGVAACSVDAIDGVGPARGGTGAIGDECSCANGQADCDGSQAVCQQGLSCVRADSGGRNTCTRACPCPLGFLCRAAAIPGARLACFKTP